VGQVHSTGTRCRRTAHARVLNMKTKIRVQLPAPHSRQGEFVGSKHKRIIVRAGRRGGKTVGVAIRAVEKFLQGRRQLYGAPTTEQIDRFWFEIVRALGPLIDAGVLKKNETEHYIERPGTDQRIKAKTVWNADTLRGDYADDLYLDEWQLMDEDAWEVVGAPMLLDNNGDVVFIYTPPSLRSAGVSKARDPRHAAKMFKMAREDTTGLWQAFHFTSHDNPHISKEGLSIITSDMSAQAYRQEIMAEDDELSSTQLVYGKFNETICKAQRFEIPNTWPVYVGHDFGGANPAALFSARVKLPIPSEASPYIRHGDFVVFREYLPGPGYSTAQHVERFKLIVKGMNLEGCVGGSHQEEGWRGDFTAHGWPIREPKISSVLPQVDRVIGLMELNKLHIFNDLFNYLEEIMNCLWERDSKGVIIDKIQDEARYHLCACARYKFSDFTPETVISGAPKTTYDERY